LQAEEVIRAWAVATADPEDPQIVGGDEAHGRVEVLLDVAPQDFAVPEVVGVLQRRSVREIVAGNTLVHALQAEGVEDEVPSTPQEVRGGQPYIRTQRRAGGVTVRIPSSDKRPDIGLGEQI